MHVTQIFHFYIVPKCGEFHFNTVAFNASSEFLVRAEIRLWLSTYLPSTQSGYVVAIKPVFPDERESRIIMRWLEVGDSSHYAVFDVTDELLRSLQFGSKGGYRICARSS